MIISNHIKKLAKVWKANRLISYNCCKHFLNIFQSSYLSVKINVF